MSLEVLCILEVFVAQGGAAAALAQARLTTEGTVTRLASGRELWGRHPDWTG